MINANVATKLMSVTSSNSTFAPLCARFPVICTASEKVWSAVGPVFQAFKFVNPMFICGVAATIILGKVVQLGVSKVRSYIDEKAAQNALAKFEKEQLKKYNAGLSLIQFAMSGCDKTLETILASETKAATTEINNASDLDKALKAISKPYLDVTANIDLAIATIEEDWQTRALALPESVRGEALAKIENKLKALKEGQGALRQIWTVAAETEALNVLYTNNNYRHNAGFGANTTLSNATNDVISKAAQKIIENPENILQAFDEVEMFVVKRSNALKKPDGIGPLGGLSELFPANINFDKFRYEAGFDLPLLILLAKKNKEIATAPQVAKDKAMYEARNLELMIEYVQNRGTDVGRAAAKELAQRIDNLMWDNHQFYLITRSEDIVRKTVLRETKEEASDLTKALSGENLSNWINKLTTKANTALQHQLGTVVDTSFLQSSLFTGKTFQFVRPAVFSSTVDKSQWSSFKKVVDQAKKSGQKINNPINHIQLEATNCEIIKLSSSLRAFGYDPKSKQPTSSAVQTDVNYATNFYRYAHEWALASLKKAIMIIDKTHSPQQYAQSVGAQLQQAIIEVDQKPHLFSILTAAKEMYKGAIISSGNKVTDENAYAHLAKDLGTTTNILRMMDVGAASVFKLKNNTSDAFVKSISGNVSATVFSAQ